MNLYGHGVLVLLAPLVVFYVTLLGIGYLIADEREWRNRTPLPKIRQLPEVKAETPSETVREPVRLLARPKYGFNRLPRGPASKPIPRRSDPSRHR